MTGSYFDLPAILITLILTVVLVKGIQESATFNAVMVAVKLVIVLMVIGIGAFFVRAENWHPFAPFGFAGVSFFGHTLFGQTAKGGEPLGMIAGAAIIFFAYIGFDSVSVHSYRHCGVFDYMHCPLHCCVGGVDGNGAVFADQHRCARR